MRLICPRDNSRPPIDLDTISASHLPSLLAEVAGRLGLPYGYDAAAQKIYLGDRPAQSAIRLDVPYYYQGDSDVAGQAWRMCFSSSCAMLLETLKPGTLAGGNGDDQYLRRVQQYGDTTDPTAQLAALRHCGVRARYSQALDWDDVDRQLEAGIPVPIGILHHGPVTAPTGGGHWILVVGRDAKRESVLVHDPAGELDLVAGSYPSYGAGRYVTYSRRNLGRRWMVEGPGTGWGILAERP